MPATIEAYNHGMGGVDLFNQIVASYRPHIRKRKWWWCLHIWSLTATSMNAWRLQMAVTNIKVSYLSFLRGLVCGLLKTFGETRKRPGRSITVKRTAGDSLRMDSITGLWEQSRDWCANCLKTG